MATIGRYELRQTLGIGGFATVYRAWDALLQREVALKVLLPHLAAQPAVRRRFLAEARALAGLRHPHIVVVYDVAVADAQPFYTMEFIDGVTVDELTIGGPRPLAEVAALLTPLADAVDYLHTAGLIHRDIKAANVMRDRRGRVVLMDFGIARVVADTARTTTGSLLGTPETIAPEQVRGEPVGPAADIYALGVLAYLLLAGRPPFVGEVGRVLYAHAHEPPPALAQLCPALPAAAGAAVHAALAKEADLRPPTAAALAARLAQALAGTPGAATPGAAGEERPLLGTARPSPMLVAEAAPDALRATARRAPTRPRRRPAGGREPRRAAPGMPYRRWWSVGRRTTGGVVALLLLASVAVVAAHTRTGLATRHAGQLGAGGSPAPAAPRPATPTPRASPAAAKLECLIATPRPAAVTSLMRPRSDPPACGVRSEGIVVDGLGRVYLSDFTGAARGETGGCIRQLDYLRGLPCVSERLVEPTGLALSAQGRLFVAESGANRILRRAPGDQAGRVLTPLTADPSLTLRYPRGIAVDETETVYIADTNNHRIVKLSPSGALSILAGTGAPGYTDGPGRVAQFRYPVGVALDPHGNLYVADTENHVIRRVTPAGEVSTVAGAGTAGFGDGVGRTAQFRRPHGIASAANGTLYVADTENNRIRKIDASGAVTTLAGGEDARQRDGDLSEARFDHPTAIAVSRTGELYVVEGNDSTTATSALRRVRD